MIVKKQNSVVDKQDTQKDLIQPNQILFKLPAYGPADYYALGQQILSDELILPSGEEIAKLVHKSYCIKESLNEPAFEYIRTVLNESPISIFNINYWTDMGVFVFPDIKVEGIYKNVKQKELEKILENGIEINNVLFSKNSKFRFAPKWSYYLGEQNHESIINDGYFIAQFGIEGARRLSELVKITGKKPISYGFDIEEGNQPKLRVSLLEIENDKIHFVGNNEFGSIRGRTFGIQGYL
ncbi:MAG: hypothetical protein WC867_01115 [Candidatus Pacearchaeota archaeon]|jgi:hypothetical protein